MNSPPFLTRAGVSAHARGLPWPHARAALPGDAAGESSGGS